MKSVALTLALIMMFTATRKWPCELLHYRNLHGCHITQATETTQANRAFTGQTVPVVAGRAMEEGNTVLPAPCRTAVLSCPGDGPHHLRTLEVQEARHLC